MSVRSPITSAGIVLSIVIGGCAQPPVEHLEAAKQAAESAKTDEVAK